MRNGNDQKADFSEYQTDPHGCEEWCEKYLGYKYAPKIKEVMRSVWGNPVTFARSCNSYGKSHGAASIAVCYLNVFPAAKVYLFAAPPLSNLQNILWAEISQIIRNHRNLFDGLKITYLRVGTPVTPDEKEKESVGRWVMGLRIPKAADKNTMVAQFSGKHSKYQLFIGDEADGCPDPCFEGIETCNTGEDNRLLALFNPKKKAGHIFRKERDKQAKIIHLSALEHPNVIEGKEILPGAVTRAKVVDRINRYCRLYAPNEPIVEAESFKLPDFLTGETAISPSGEVYQPLKAGVYKIEEPAFSYIVLGRYPHADENQLISEVWIENARSRWNEYVRQNGEVMPRFGKVVAGLDVAEFGKDSNSLTLRAKNFVPNQKKWRGLDPIQTGAKAYEECKAFNVSICNVDGNGVGAGVAPHMKNLGIPTNNLKSQNSPTCKMSELGDFKILRDELFWRVARWLEKEDAMLPPNELLLEELRVLTYEIKGGYIRIMPKDVVKDLLKRSPDDSDSLSLTFYPDTRVFV